MRGVNTWHRGMFRAPPRTCATCALLLLLAAAPAAGFGSLLAQQASSPLSIVIIGWNRPTSLERLLRSLEAAEYGLRPAPMEVVFALDAAGNSSVDDAMDDTLRSFRWPHGTIRVRRRRARAGLRDNVLGAWSPAREDPPAVFLEDDVEVSPLWWHWIQACLSRYAPDPARPPAGLLGVSLYTLDELNEPYENGGTTGADGKFTPSCGWQAEHHGSKAVGAASALYFAQPCSWGALYFAGQWRDFRRAAASLRAMPIAKVGGRPPPGALPSLPCPAGARRGGCDPKVNRWGASSWKRLMALHVVAHGLYMVYPNLPGRASFSTNHVEPGTHLAANPLVLEGQRRRHTVRLVTRRWCAAAGLRCEHAADALADGGPQPQAAGAAAPAAHAQAARVPFALPPAESVRLWDFYCARQPAGEAGRESLRSAGEPLRAKLPPPAEAAEGAELPDPAEGLVDEYALSSAAA